MTQGTVTYSGVLYPKGAVYTQTRGVTPDIVLLRMIPQTQAVPYIGDVVMTLGTSSLTIRDCLVDRSQIRIDKNGFIGALYLFDRRWRWSRYPAFSAFYNERNSDGIVVTQSSKSLKGILLDLFTHIGESTVDLSLVSDSYYPEVNVRCEQADVIIQNLCDQHGLEVCLGYGNDSVKVWPSGQGTSLPNDGRVIIYTSTVDPPDPPYQVDVCFGPSEAQARFKLKAVGLDTDGFVKNISDLSYTPATGWNAEPPEFPNVLANSGDIAWRLARETVFRWYRVVQFSDGTLDIPDGSGTLGSIDQIFPLLPGLLEVETQDGIPTHPKPRAYGSYTWSSGFGVGHTTGVDDPVEVSFTLDRYRGIVMFDEPVAIMSNGLRTDAALYLEAAFRVRDWNNRQFVSYVYRSVIDQNGQGTKTIQLPEENARTIFLYGSGHVLSGSTTNKSVVDSTAQAAIQAASGMYSATIREMALYNWLAPDVKPDGTISQVKHVITDGTDGEFGSHTFAARQMDSDPGIRPSWERSNDRAVTASRLSPVSRETVRHRSDFAND